MKLKGKARNWNITLSLSQQTILFFFTKVLPEKQNKKTPLWLLAATDLLAFIKAGRQGKVLIGSIAQSPL